ncbi:MAG: ABC transporter ATP-binding protein [Alphaproteobacteria bacterium]|nr:ABC transporter ATP-binding protein [Alphaproteobacteria bacterium]
MSAAPAAAIRLDNVTLGYDRHPAVHHLSGRFAPGSLTAVVGPNGAGKSTLLKGIAGALKPFDGRIAIEGCTVADVAYLPQQHDIDRSFPISVLDVVALGLWRRIGAFGAIDRAARARVGEALAAVGLEGFERRPIGKLSGGQLQRALFARLLLQDARVILLDEPFTAIDPKTAADLLDLVQRWHGERRTIIAVLHDMETVRRHFPQALLLARRLLAWGDTADALRPQNLLAARRMVEAWDDRADICAAAEA